MWGTRPRFRNIAATSACNAFDQERRRSVMLGLKSWLRGGRPASAAPRRQVGAIPYVVEDGIVRFLLVTSRRTGSWIFPKGGLMAGLGPSRTAAREAFEEAGVRGVIGPVPIGAYGKTDSGTGRTVRIPMYPLQVREELRSWPEQGQRQRRWATLEEACSLLAHPELIRLARRTSAAALRRQETSSGR
jgi:8-oxo-dGTP pyrophosphatase MutT (NUDIX family)